jgi:hypothetical protein
MAEVIREGQSIRVVLIDGGTETAAAPLVSKVRQVLLDEPVADVVVELPGEEMAPDKPVVSEVIQRLTAETWARGVPLRFKL